ncbi:MAG: rod shape-determining protein RodA [Desulfurivibrionaceae bacterium]
MLRFDRRLLQNFDWVILLFVLIIATMSIMNLYSITYQDQGSSNGLYLKQLYYFIIGLGVIGVIICFDYRKLLNWDYTIYTATIITLLYVLVFGLLHVHTKRWIDLGPVNFQPSEAAKLALIIVLASYYSRYDTSEGLTLKELLIPILLTAVPFLLILKQPDLGTALLLIFIFASMTIFVKLKWSTFAILTTITLSIIPVAWKFLLKPYQKERIESLFSPDKNLMTTGYQIFQSKIAMGSGGLLGKGYLKGTQGHLNFLPEKHTDFAFSIWAEEFGFAGSFIFLVVYFTMILWGLKISCSSKDKFGTLLCLGVASLILWQSLINLAMVMGLLPVVGMPLPLFSYGGSSLLTTMAGIGIMINVRMRRYQMAR